MDFILDLPRTQQHVDYVMVVVDRFLKVSHFVPCKRIGDAHNVVQHFFKEIIKVNGVPYPLLSTEM